MKKAKTTPETKLKSYSALAASLIAVGSSADAQIVYTNVTDYYGIFNGDNYPLDLNNDGNIDFNISMAKSSYSSYFGWTFKFVQVAAKPVSSNGVARASSSSYNAALLALNSPIDVNNNWGYGSNANMENLFMSSGWSYQFGQWAGAKDQYLGLKLVMSGNTYYGWARLDVAAKADTFIFKDYAYQLTKDKQILAGDKGITTGITGTEPWTGSVYAHEGIVYVNLEEEGLGSNISITNVLGEEVKAVVAEDRNNRIDMKELSKGIYFVTVRKEGTIKTSKVYL